MTERGAPQRLLNQQTLVKRLTKLLLYPEPWHILVLRKLFGRLRLGSFHFRQALGILSYPGYAYCMYQSARLAKALGHDEISAIELGVAGGNGLVAMERHAAEITAALGVRFKLYGFDAAGGLPPPQDYRDLPYHWREGFFLGDRKRLMERLSSSKVFWGPIRDTLAQFFDDNPAPIGTIFFDLDFYSSTRDAFAIFDFDRRFTLPRVFCYLDDIFDNDSDLDDSLDLELINDWTGVRLAVNEFNEHNDRRKLARRYQLPGRYVRAPWLLNVHIYHDFDHPEYCKWVSSGSHQLPLSE